MAYISRPVGTLRIDGVSRDILEWSITLGEENRETVTLLTLKAHDMETGEPLQVEAALHGNFCDAPEDRSVIKALVANIRQLEAEVERLTGGRQS
jgi:hypothetical protein